MTWYRPWKWFRRKKPEKPSQRNDSGPGMVEERYYKKRVYRAYVFCPMNKGQMILEYEPGDKIADLIAMLRNKWKIKLPIRKIKTLPTKEKDVYAGWNILGKAEDEVYVPLHVYDNIPLSPNEISQWYREGASKYRGTEGRFEKASMDYLRRMFTIGEYVVDIGSRIKKEFAIGKHVFDIGSKVKWIQPQEDLIWPNTHETVDIELCVVVAIAGG